MRTPGDAVRGASRRRGKRLHWHSRVHKDWGKERLYFWRLRFRPTYMRDDLQRALRELLAEARIGSYMVYEVFGDFDLLIRLWLPSTIAAQEFSDLLEERLGPLDLDDHDNFEVDSILRHWVWGEGDPVGPSDARMLEPPLSDEQIAEVNGGQPSRALLDHLREQHLVKDVNPSDGIKFAMTITTPVKGLPPEHRRRAQTRLKEIVDAAGDIHERSLYYGHGLGVFVILGRVAHRHFDALRAQLADPIARQLGNEWIGARTYTMVVASWELLPFRDELPLAQALRDEEIAIEEALTRPEGLRVEVKGSAFVNFDRMLLGGRDLEEDPRITHSVLRTIAAMLNTEGGTLVIGALEPERYANCEQLAEWPRLGEYACAGIHHDWGIWANGRGNGRGTGWDRFDRELNKRIADRIQPLASTWLRITLERVGDVPLARVVVKRPDRHWYHVHALDPDKRGFASGGQRRTEFFVRRGGSSVVLDGVDADEYKRMQPWR